MEGPTLPAKQMEVIPFDLSNLKDLKSHCRLRSKEELLDLYQRWKEGDQQAFNSLVYSQMRLALSIADKFRSTKFRDDLRSEAIYALLYAIKVWDPKRGALSTIVTRIVRQRLTKYIEEHKYLIRLPLTLKIAKRRKRYKKNLQPILRMVYFPKEEEVPSSKEVDLDLQLDLKQLEYLLNCLTETDRALIYDYFKTNSDGVIDKLCKNLNLSKYKIKKRINEILNRLTNAGKCYICKIKFKPSPNSLNYCPKCWDMLSKLMLEWGLAVCPICYKLFSPAEGFSKVCSQTCNEILTSLN